MDRVKDPFVVVVSPTDQIDRPGLKVFRQPLGEQIDLFNLAIFRPDKGEAGRKRRRPLCDDV